MYNTPPSDEYDAHCLSMQYAQMAISPKPYQARILIKSE